MQEQTPCLMPNKHKFNNMQESTTGLFQSNFFFFSGGFFFFRLWLFPEKESQYRDVM